MIFSGKGSIYIYVYESWMKNTNFPVISLATINLAYHNSPQKTVGHYMCTRANIYRLQADFSSPVRLFFIFGKKMKLIIYICRRKKVNKSCIT